MGWFCVSVSIVGMRTRTESSTLDKRGLPGGRVFLLIQLARLAGCDASQLVIGREEIVDDPSPARRGRVLRIYWHARAEEEWEVW